MRTLQEMYSSHSERVQKTPEGRAMMASDPAPGRFGGDRWERYDAEALEGAAGRSGPLWLITVAQAYLARLEVRLGRGDVFLADACERLRARLGAVYAANRVSLAGEPVAIDVARQLWGEAAVRRLKGRP